MQPSHNRKIGNSNPTSTFEKIEKLHPHKMLLYLAIIGSSLIFLFMLVAFTATHTGAEIQESLKFTMPKAFVLSSIIILFSSYFVSRFLRTYQNENMKKLRNLLGITVVLGLVFTLCQYWGWHQLEQAGYGLTGLSSGAYLYVLSGIHILHLVAGIFFMTYQFIKVSRVANDQVKCLIMVTNPYEKMKLEMATTYWHFIDFLWISLFLYFLFMF